ncbi:RES family NAD+ phosphorylase [Paenibacillus sp. Marseille-Q4541]|uniref:RES family NAD+ phosphorylase n=1 Tax=Paenibacillus sp. Marseille-Q4541 TaxID=2831522 RepID=UPI001BAA084D|nr:RES family NAD+ phosphorylase [Paenibacillus sp. Marseille-Q4541]
MNNSIYVEFSEFFYNLMYKSRYFYDEKLVGMMAEVIENNVLSIDASEDRVLYRARLNNESEMRRREIEKYPANEMGAPPIYYSSNGRANPRGITYLYAAEDIDTAIAEVRPYKRAEITVAKLVYNEPVRLFDVVLKKHEKSPKSDSVKWIMNHYMSNPIDPNNSDLEYIASQFICEIVKNLKLDGIRFPSSLRNGGINVLLFDPSMMTIQEETNLYTVTKIDIKVMEG